MPSLLSRIFGRGEPSKTAGHGFVYVPLSEDGPLTRAAAGGVVRTGHSGPPWIVVNHAIESVVVARWPGKLWEVEIVQAASEQPFEGTGYTRAVAVKVLGEVPVATLFGPHGADVVRVIELAASIDIAGAEALGGASTSLAREAYSRAWLSWLATVDPSSVHLDGDHADTLAVFGIPLRSPIGGGFTVIHSALGDRARELAGDSAFVVGEEDDVSFAAPWDHAADALVHAAMAFGAPEQVSDAERQVLTEAWDRCFGRR